MLAEGVPTVAIVDYGMGNLFSIQTACMQVSLNALITSDKSTIAEADGVVLPGIGAFGDAMATLRRLDLPGLLRDLVEAGKPLFGICLGLQLLMTESEEFGHHRGLNLIEGDVVRIPNGGLCDPPLKVPEVCWNQVWARSPGAWEASMLEGLIDGEYMYFVHSYHARPVTPEHVMSTTRYGELEFCSSLGRHNLFACQFHPERSGSEGLRIYRNLAARLRTRAESLAHV